MRQLTGWHVATMFGLAFGTIIAVNLTLAFNAVRTFPGLEVKNSYVASQAFQAERAAQSALGWTASASLAGDELTLRFDRDGLAVVPALERAVFGRATNVLADQQPDFDLRNGVFRARVAAGPGNWNLRVVARAEDGTRFQQRIVVEIAE